MSAPTADLAPTAALVADVVRGVRDDDLSRPTPCPGTTVAAMLDHLAGLATAFAAAAHHERVPGGAPGLFGPPVAVEDHGTPLEQLLGLTGRDPRWSSG